MDIAHKICALMIVELNVKVRSGQKLQDIDDIDTIVNAIKNNPFYFFDIDIVDKTSMLFPEHNKPEELANPFFE